MSGTNSLYVDNRSGSIEMFHMFPSGVPVEATHLEFGDFSFMGNGKDGPVFVGIERKAIRDLLNSIVTGRLSGHQVIGLLDTYTYSYLLVEGIWRSNPTNGLLEVRRGNSWDSVEMGQRRFMARELIGYLNTLQVMTDIMVITTRDKMESSRFILALYRWWQKEWTDHTSHLARNKTPKEITLVRPSLVRRIASELPGIGWGKSQAVDEHFLSVEDMILASEKKWASIPGIGKKLSQNIVKCLKGDYL